MLIGEPLGQHLANRQIDNIKTAGMAPDPQPKGNWGGMLVTEMWEAAGAFAGKFEKSPPKKLYGIERIKK
jgi:hypothetical protein